MRDVRKLVAVPEEVRIRTAPRGSRVLILPPPEPEHWQDAMFEKARQRANRSRDLQPATDADWAAWAKGELR